MSRPLRRRAFLGRCAALAAGLWGLILALPGAAVVFDPLLRRRSEERQWVLLGLQADAADQAPKLVPVSFPVVDGWRRRQLDTFLYLVREEGEWIALAPVCTHLGCKVGWSERDLRFRCPCHGGAYDMGGRVIAGPPPRPLARLPLRLHDGQVEVEVSALA